MRQKKIRSKRKQDLESDFVDKVRKNAPIVIMVVAVIGLAVAIIVFAYNVHVRHSEMENLKSQIDSSIRNADSLCDAGLFGEAIDEYEGILEIVSPKKLVVS